MNRNTIIISLLFLFLCPSLSFSKDKLRKYSSGYYVTNNNDTINGYLKNLSLSISCVRIKFKKNNESKPIDLYPESVKSYKRGMDFFVSKDLGDGDFSVRAFVKPIVVDQLSLYRRWVTRTNGTQYGSYTTEVEMDYIKLPEKQMLKIKKAKFRKKVSSYLSDHQELSLKILNKEIRDIEIVVYKYNRWHKSGRKNDPLSPVAKAIKDKLDRLTDSKFALEVSLSVVKSTINVEAQLAKYVDVKDGISPDVGLGFRLSISDEFKFRFGAHFWMLPINPSYDINIEGLDNELITFHVEEESKLSNTSIYLHLHYEGRHAFIGGGLNFGLINKYITHLSYYDQEGNFIYSEKDTRTFLTDEFLNQSHFDILAGLKFTTKSKIAFKPFVKANLPFKPIYDSNSPSNTAFDMHAYQLNLGLIVEFGLVK